MAKTCDGDIREVGPFEQTLFLGCSVSKFGVNMGWGTDASSASITLVQDVSYAPNAIEYSPLINEINKISTTISGKKSNTFSSTVDSNKDLHQGLAKSIDIPGRLNGGSKITWSTKVGGSKKYNGRDPGFLGLDRGVMGPAFDIMGVPVRFKFVDGVEFGGYVHSWKAAGSQGGSPIFEVELRSFANLLNNCWLIIDSYSGSISSLIPGVNINGIDIAVPTLDTNANFKATIGQGNIPNVFNIYGNILDNGDFAAFGQNSDGYLIKSEQGLSAYAIYANLVSMLGSSSPQPSSFAPYGAIVGRTIMDLDGNITRSNTKIPTTTDMTLEDMGLCPNVVSSDGFYRSLFKLDISEIPAPPIDLYIPGATTNIGTFIDTITKGVGLDYYVSFYLDDNYTGVIKINTISRRSQPSRNNIKNMVFNLLGGTAGTKDAKYSGFRYGEEYNDTVTRTMYIGGKQKRLYQALSTHLALQQTTMVFDPYKGTFMPVLSNSTNAIRVPDENSTRYLQYDSKIGNGTAAVVAQFNDETTFANLDRMGGGFDVCQGNYYSTIDKPVGVTPTNNTNHPLYLDLICPYFGANGGDYDESGSGDNTGNSTISYSDARKVFWDKETHQLKITFQKNDITRILSQPYFEAGEFVVTENEIRAAGAVFESWFVYCFENFFSPHIETLMYTAFRKTYSNIPNNFFNAIGIIHWTSIAKDKQSQNFKMNPSDISMENANTYVRAFYEDLKKVHNFFAGIHSKYYGKQYMVRTPNMRYYTSYSGKVFSDWEVSTDGAWEEPGNFIDDTIVVGSTLSDLFADDTGKIGTILGFNANAEKATRDDWLDTNLRENRGGMFATLAKAYSKFTSRDSAQDPFFYFPLEHNLSPSDYAYVKYASPEAVRKGLTFTPENTIPKVKFSTAQGDDVPTDWSYKMYVRAQADSKIAFIDHTPRIIISINNPINIGGGKNECENSLAFVMMHDAILANKYNSKTFKAGLIGSDVSAGCSLAWMLAGPASLTLGYTPSLSINNSGPNMPIAPKAVCPAFAAIPIQYNLATYGPWINHPGLVASNIFGQDMDNVIGAVNNLVGGLKVEEESNLVPWEYGGMTNLDNIITERIKDDVNYQQVLEQGEINVVGFLLTNPTTALPYFVGDIINGKAGPVINNITIDIGENGITSNYVMRTYTRKIGFYNKETADRYQQIAKDNFKRKKELSNSINAATNAIKQNFFPSYDSMSSMGGTPKPLRWSPAGVLAGGNYLHLNKESAITDSIYNSLSYSPDWYMKPFGKNLSITPKDMPRYLSDIGLQEAQELPRELDKDYDRKSIMSLDGLLSPISFYPNFYGSTYSITKYPRSQCAMCGGKGTYEYKYLDTTKLQPGATFDQIKNAQVSRSNIPCYFCEQDDIKDKNKKKSITPKETTPPYIIASGNDLEIISSNSLAGINGISGNPIINYSTLNPVLLMDGEFSCYQNRQNDDSSAHCIDMVGAGLTVPREGNSLKLSYGKNINNNFSQYDINYKSYCISEGEKPMSFTEIDNYPNKENAPANNMRFFGLRGPLMVHAWGYDLEGYPVPNASGEPQLNSDGSIKRIDANGNIITDPTGIMLYKNQTQNPDGSWTKPYKEHTFYKGWGQLPGTWPVGPVDLRWDDNARIWTVGANYKNVWVQIENDLIGNEPSRGQIISDLDKNPLPNDLRKLVFVKDNLGINPAPRGAQIYCKYDSDSGFYEPIYNRPFITSGVIQGASSADIYQIYSTDNTKYRTTYKNPLSFNVSNGENGLFIFMGDSWVLQSYGAK